jgi:hypothetical protein
VRRLCCDADILPVVFGSDGVVLDVGRAARLATADQRRALAAMYSRCGHPDCHVAYSTAASTTSMTGSPVGSRTSTI